jgi:hypothetical protein
MAISFMRWLSFSLCIIFLTACYFDKSDSSSSPDKVLSTQQLQFDDAGPVYLKIGDSLSNPATALGEGAISYQSSDENVATVDSDGLVIALAIGSATITATKSSDDIYGEASSSYRINTTFSMTAWVGEQDTQLSFSQGSQGLEFYRSADIGCDLLNFAGCDLGLMNVLGDNTIIDTMASFKQQALYQFTKSDQSSSFRASFPPENLPARKGHQVVSFNNKLWLMGGTDYESPYTPKSDVWSSQDGIHWIKEVKALPFEGLKGYKVIVFKDKLWVVGGYSSWENREDSKSIWSSIDGINWIEETSEALFGARYSKFKITVFNKKLWLFDNKDDSTEIWSSENGVVWLLHSSEFNTAPRFEQSVIVFNHKLWSLGDSGLSTRENIWSSSNGIDWKKNELTPRLEFDSRSTRFNIAVINNKLTIFDSSNSWTSDDGVNWIQERNGDNGGIGVSDWSATVFYQDQLWVIGGNKYDYQNEAWSSADGINWKPRKEDVSILSRSGFKVAEFNGKLWFSGGFGSEELKYVSVSEYSLLNNNDTWSSSDGINWQKEISDAKFTSRFNHRMFSFKDQLWVVAGGYYREDNGYTHREDIWSSTDGINWVEKVKEVPFSKQNRYSITEFNEKLWLIDAYKDASDIFKNDIWSSEDGINWTLEVSDAGWFEGYNAQLAVLNNKMWLVGDRIESVGGEFILKDYWSTSDGINWEEEVATFPSWVSGDWYFLEHKNKLLIIFGDNYINEKARVLSSANGTDWIEDVISDEVNFSTSEGSFTLFNDEIWLSGGLVTYKQGGWQGSELRISPEPWKSVDGINWRKGIKTEIGLINQL